MSTFLVDVCLVEEVRPHPNADRLEIVRVKNWSCITPIGQFHVGEKCVYFPPDTVMDESLAERFGITKYLSACGKEADGSRPSGLRVRAARLRGERSFGFITTPDDPNWEVGANVAEHYGVWKYEPPIRAHDGDAAPPHAAFHEYTGIEHIGNFPGVLVDGEEVVVDEKIHGSNCRVGKILCPDPETGVARFSYMCGSHGVNRKEFDVQGERSKYWSALTPEVQALLDNVCDEKRNVVVFGELFGAGIQDMQYGLKGLAFRAFDISVEGKYLDTDEKEALCRMFAVPVVPHLYRGPFSLEKIAEFTDGPTTVCDPSVAGAFKGREGIVIRPAKERYSANMPNFGRVIFKSVSVDYYARKGGTEYH